MQELRDILQFFENDSIPMQRFEQVLNRLLSREFSFGPNDDQDQTERVKDDAPAAGVAPYQGLHYFDEEDVERFFGREKLTLQLVAHLHGQSFLAVVLF